MSVSTTRARLRSELQSAADAAAELRHELEAKFQARKATWKRTSPNRRGVERRLMAKLTLVDQALHAMRKAASGLR